jgi:hypothetical protein
MECSYVITAILLLVITRYAIRAGKREPGLVIGLSMMILIIYGMIALGRTELYNQLRFDLDNAALIGRYHYMAGAIIAILTCLVGIRLQQRGGVASNLLGLILLSWIAVVSFASFQVTRTGDNSGFIRYDPDLSRTIDRTIALLHASILRQDKGTTVYLENKMVPGLWVPLDDGRNFPNLAALYIISNPNPDNSYEGRQVRFIEADARILDYVLEQPGTRASKLLVSTETMPRVQ